jgi:dihydroneopterin aldolase
MTDRIHVEGIEAYGYHGVLAEERVLGQTLVVDLAVDCDLRQAGRSDRMADSISYVDLEAIARAVVETTPHQLIEAVAERIAERILELPLAQGVRVKVAKPRVPHPGVRGRVSIEITRQKG